MPVFSSGSIELMSKGLPNNVLGYKRTLDHTEVIVLLNFGGSRREVQVPPGYKPRLGVHKTDILMVEKVSLHPYGGIVLVKE